MTDDIVTRLRALTEVGSWVSLSEWDSVTKDAADEIERLQADRDRWAKWGEHIFTCPNKGVNPCYDCVSPVTRDAMNRVDKGGAW